MELLIGLILIIPLLWLWLAGHWFGRVLAFIGFAIALGAGGATFMLSIAPGSGPGGGGVYGFVLGVGLAWLLASWPIWHQRKLAKAAAEELAAMAPPKWDPSSGRWRQPRPDEIAQFLADLGRVQQVPRLIDGRATEGRFAGRQ